LRSLLRLSWQPDEIIVVDDGSSDGASQMIRSEFPTIILIRNEKNLGAAASRNRAVEIAKGSWLWFLDSDVIVENPHCLQGMRVILKACENIGALGGEYSHYGKEMLYCRKYVFPNGETISRRIPKEQYRMLECDYVPTNNCIVKKSLLVNLGGFDPVYRVSSEDCELGYKIKQARMRNVVDYRTAVFHNLDVERRPSDLMKAIINRVRFVFKNFTMREIICLPYYEISYIFRSGQINNVMRKDYQAVKHLPQGLRQMVEQGGELRIFGLIAISMLYLFYLVTAYIYNLLMLPWTLYSRSKQGYL